jgi:hypothetical protein
VDRGALRRHAEGTSTAFEKGAAVTIVLTREPQLETARAPVSAPRRFTPPSARREPVVPEPAIADGGRVAAATSASDIVDQWGLQSFPASDPPSNW